MLTYAKFLSLVSAISHRECIIRDQKTHASDVAAGRDLQAWGKPSTLAMDNPPKKWGDFPATFDTGGYTSGYVNSLLLKPWPSRNSGFSHEKMVIFHSYVAVYQRVYL